MAAFNKELARKYLQAFDFRNLFVEALGWGRNENRIDPIKLDGESYKIEAIADQEGVQIFLVHPGKNGQIPITPHRSRLHVQIRKQAHEHLLIFVDAKQEKQLWNWFNREDGRRVSRSLEFNRQQSGELMLQTLQKFSFSFEQAGNLNILDVTGRLRSAFNKDKVTKSFYTKFDKERKAFEKLITGIDDAHEQSWYVSVMINRLMFIYFIQKRGFLGNGDIDYLSERLKYAKKNLGKDSYYRRFLCPLFFEGFAKPESDRSKKMNELLEQVPYLNGGLFMKHQVEQHCGEQIDIPDKAFDKLFAFFDEFKWHLDETAIVNDKEINPDVLGYIFEKYINQKQMGAYYTKEDITGYISQNTIIPFILQRMKEQCAVAFEKGGSVWKLLQEDPDRYIYDAVRKGVVNEDGGIIPEDTLPDFVKIGMQDPEKRMFEKRYNLGLVGDELGLPTETWREYSERRQRCLELREKLSRGDLHEINDLITYNLDIRQFMQDVIELAGGTDLIKACWIALHGDHTAVHRGEVSLGITVLDPTVGSGAFLFAALNVLQPLYDACLNRMNDYVSDKHAAGKPFLGDEKFFEQVLDNIAQHPNREYFILKSIAVDNLYGVDIMDEACEICKLRLFLKLVAQIDDVGKIEPLPDIDFNIRAGNSLVGFANEMDVKRALQPIGGNASFDFEDELPAIKDAASNVDQQYRKYRNLQVQTGVSALVFSDEKEKLIVALSNLTNKLNQYLARQYKVDPDNTVEYLKWKTKHAPFHWWAEFHGIVSKGGFDVVIGNPPYVEYPRGIKEYKIINYDTLKCGNLYAFIIERVSNLVSTTGIDSMIVPLSGHSTIRMNPLINKHYCSNCQLFIINLSADAHPSVLFNGVNFRLAIYLRARTTKYQQVRTTSYLKWYQDEREDLFTSKIMFALHKEHQYDNCIPKYGDRHQISIDSKLKDGNLRFGSQLKRKSDYNVYYKKTGIAHWFTITLEPPKYINNNVVGNSTREAVMPCKDEQIMNLAFALFNSSLFYIYYIMNTNCRDFNPGDVKDFPISKSILELNFKSINESLWNCLLENSKMIPTKHSIAGSVTYQQFQPSRCKAIIDELDVRLAEALHMSKHELDYICNYQLKYRMGKSALLS